MLVLPIQETTGKGGVFYNPRMSLNRDLAVLFASSHFSSERRLRVCDPMTGSGVRAVRYVLESTNVETVFAADKDAATVESARAAVRLNGLEENITVVESDANTFLQDHVQERFDLVDLDPFGSPAPFFESAARATTDGGVVASTATDMGPLTGARPAACYRKYGSRSIRSEFEKEMAVRVLAGCLASTAGRLQLGINIAFAHASDHYARIYAAIMKGRPSANTSVKSVGFVEYCPNCLRRDARHSLEGIRTICEDCRRKTIIGGPLWLGPLWDIRTVQGMVERTPMLYSSRLSEIQRILTYGEQESRFPAFYYRTDSISRSLGTKPPALAAVFKALREAGYRTTGTHFHPNGFRTNADNREIISIVRSLSQKT